MTFTVDESISSRPLICLYFGMLFKFLFWVWTFCPCDMLVFRWHTLLLKNWWLGAMVPKSGSQKSSKCLCSWDKLGICVPSKLSKLFLLFEFPQVQVPHSQCSLWENPKIWQNFRPLNNTLKGNVRLLFSFYMYHSILGLTFKGKNYYFVIFKAIIL
jgi:hypothetical protein